MTWRFAKRSDTALLATWYVHKDTDEAEKMCGRITKFFCGIAFEQGLQNKPTNTTSKQWNTSVWQGVYRPNASTKTVAVEMKYFSTPIDAFPMEALETNVRRREDWRRIDIKIVSVPGGRQFLAEFAAHFHNWCVVSRSHESRVYRADKENEIAKLCKGKGLTGLLADYGEHLIIDLPVECLFGKTRGAGLPKPPTFPTKERKPKVVKPRYFETIDARVYLECLLNPMPTILTGEFDEYLVDVETCDWP